MEGFRSKSYADDGRKQNPYGLQDLRCNSVSYISSSQPANPAPLVFFPKKLKPGNGNGLSSSSSKRWSFTDPELKRKKRVASYKAYGVEGKVKGSIRKGFRWLKQRCNLVVYG